MKREEKRKGRGGKGGKRRREIKLSVSLFLAVNSNIQSKVALRKSWHVLYRTPGSSESSNLLVYNN